MPAPLPLRFGLALRELRVQQDVSPASIGSVANP
jgi:hypothetical protein